MSLPYEELDAENDLELSAKSIRAAQEQIDELAAEEKELRQRLTLVEVKLFNKTLGLYQQVQDLCRLESQADYDYIMLLAGADIVKIRKQYEANR